jgi:hypothetical protein
VNALNRIVSFRPRQLLKAVEHVRRDHPDSEVSTKTVSADLINQLRTKLRSVHKSQLNSLADRLLPRELKAALQLLCMNEDELIHERADAVLHHRLRKDLVKPAWRFLLANYPLDRLESLLRFFLSHFGNDCIGGTEYGFRIQRWFSAKRLVSGLLEDFEEFPRRDVEGWFRDARIPEWAQLRPAFWRNLLCNASKNLINALGHEVLLDYARRETVSIQRGFAFNYLVQLGGRELWSAILLRWIRDQFGVPSRGNGQTHFWRRIPEEIRLEFRRWINETTIRQFFDRVRDPHGRFKFWEELIDEIEEAEVVLSNEAMLMDFGKFGVVEFSEKGNAAYVYGRTTFQRFKMMNFLRSVNDLKDQTIAEDRIIHRGPWEEKYRPKIKHFLWRSTI